MENKIRFIGKCLLIEKNKEKILIMGDLHFGYEESLNRAGVFISRKMFQEVIEEFEKILKKAGKINVVVLLGDVKHNFGSLIKQEWNDVLLFLDFLEARVKKIVITKGNHDIFLEAVVKKREKVELVNFFIWEGFAFLHGNKSFEEIYDKKIKYWILGHGHPALKLKDKEGIKIEKYKCFLIGKYKSKNVIIVPSFFGYVVGTDPRENYLGLAWKFDLEKFSVRVVGDNLKVFDFGILKKLE